MRNSQSMIANSLADNLEDLIRKFGFWRITRAFVIAVLRLRNRANHPQDLSEWMRRDIGWPEREDYDDSLKLPRWIK